jgi:hypothetical protein
MSVQQEEQRSRTNDQKETPLTTSIARLVTMMKPIGTFADRKDFTLRIRDGKLVSCDTGDQGGGQN